MQFFVLWSLAYPGILFLVSFREKRTKTQTLGGSAAHSSAVYHADSHTLYTMTAPEIDIDSEPFTAAPCVELATLGKGAMSEAGTASGAAGPHNAGLDDISRDLKTLVEPYWRAHFVSTHSTNTNQSVFSIRLPVKAGVEGAPIIRDVVNLQSRLHLGSEQPSRTLPVLPSVGVRMRTAVSSCEMVPEASRPRRRASGTQHAAFCFGYHAGSH